MVAEHALAHAEARLRARPDDPDLAAATRRAAGILLRVLRAASAKVAPPAPDAPGREWDAVRLRALSAAGPPISEDEFLAAATAARIDEHRGRAVEFARVPIASDLLPGPGERRRVLALTPGGWIALALGETWSRHEAAARLVPWPLPDVAGTIEGVATTLVARGDTGGAVNAPLVRARALRTPGGIFEE